MTQAEDTSVATELGFNPFDPAFRENPYPTYRHLRETAPVQRSPLGMFVLSRYADCATVLRSPHVSNDARTSPNFRDQMIAQGLDPDAAMLETRPFLFLDPPDHTRLRGLVNKAFTPRVVEGLRPRIQQVVHQQLDAVARKGTFEVIEDLAYPLPVIIISEMLGVPAEDAEKFKRWSRELVRGLDPEFALPPEELERRQATIEAFRAFFEDLIAKRRAEPRDDLISALIAAEDQGNQLTEAELLSTCTLLLVAGHETTVNLIGNGILALLRNPDQLQLLRDDPSLIKTAVEEVLRYDPPVQFTSRRAVEDIPLSEGVLPAGTDAVLLIAGANRDPEQFADPERLDITREDNRHIAFGMGIHFCVGAPLARLEGQIALDAFAQRFVSPRLATERPAYKELIVLRGLAELPVAFDSVRA